MSIDARDKEGRTPLLNACATGQLDMFSFLLDRGANVIARDMEGRCAAHFAAQSGNALLLAAVIAASKDLADCSDNEGVTVLHLACVSGNEQVVETLLSSLSSSDVSSLLFSQCDSRGASVLHYACHGGNVQILTRLISSSSSSSLISLLQLDAHGNTALHYASAAGKEECCAHLLRQEPQLRNVQNLRGDMPAHVAARGGHLAALQVLMSSAATLPKAAEGVDSLLHKAAFGGHAPCLSYLIGLGGVDVSTINAKGSQSATPLHKAACSGNLECVKLLLAAGALLTSRDEEDSLPIHKAAYAGHAALLETLAPVDLDQSLWLDGQGCSPLHLAAASGNEETLRLCLNLCKDASSGVDGWFVAHYAARNGNPKLVEVLSRQQLLDTETRDGRTVRDIASSEGRKDFLAALSKVQSNTNAVANALGGLEAVRNQVSGTNVHSAAHQELVNRAVALFNAKPQKGIQFLIQHKLVEDSPDGIAKFLFETETLSKKKIGELLTENDEQSQDLTNAFLRRLDFADKDFDVAVRLFLSKFMLPGEAQKIDRVMEMFANRFFTQNPKSIFANADTCYVLAFAVIMLNTDLFNPSIKKDKKMTKQQWQTHVRGINAENDLPLDFVNELYDRIKNNEIKMESETNMFAGAGKKGFCMKQGGKIRTWKKRYFVLSDHQLFYFKKATDESPLGIIPLENLTVEKEDKAVKHGFRLSSTDGGFIKSVRMVEGGAPKKGNHTFYVIGTSSAEDQMAWIDALQQQIHRSPFYELLLAKTKKNK